MNRKYKVYAAIVAALTLAALASQVVSTELARRQVNALEQLAGRCR